MITQKGVGASMIFEADNLWDNELLKVVEFRILDPHYERDRRIAMLEVSLSLAEICSLSNAFGFI